MDLKFDYFDPNIKELRKEIRKFLDSEKEELESIVINVEDYQRLGKTTFIYTQLLPFLFFDNNTKNDNNKNDKEDSKISILDKYYLDSIIYLSIEFLNALNNYWGKLQEFNLFHTKKELYNNTIDELEKQGCILVNINGIDLFNFFINTYKAYQNQITKYHISIAMFVATLRIIISKIRSKLSPNCKIKKLENKVINIAKEFHIVSNVFYLSNEKSFIFKSYIGFRNTSGQKYELNPLFFISDVMIELDKVWCELIEILKMKKLLLVLVFEDLERFTLKPDKESNQEFLEIVGNYLVLVKRYLLDPKTKNIVSIFEIPKEYSEYFSAKHYNIFNKIENSFPRDTFRIDVDTYFIRLLRYCIIYLNYLELYYYFEYKTSFEYYYIHKKKEFKKFEEDLNNIISFKTKSDVLASLFQYLQEIIYNSSVKETIDNNIEILIIYYDIFSKYSIIRSFILNNYNKEKFYHFTENLNKPFFMFEDFNPKIEVYFSTNSKKAKISHIYDDDTIKKYIILLFSYILISSDIYIIQIILDYIYENFEKNSFELIKFLLSNKIYEVSPILFILSSYVFLLNKHNKKFIYQTSFDNFIKFLEEIKTKSKNLKIYINNLEIDKFDLNLVFQLNNDIISFPLLESLINNISENYHALDKNFTEKETTIIKELLLSIEDLPEFMKNKINDLKEIKYSQLLCILVYIGFIKYIFLPNLSKISLLKPNTKIKSFYYYLDENKLEDITIKELKETIKKLKSIKTKEELINYLKNNKNFNKALLEDIKYLLLYLMNS